MRIFFLIFILAYVGGNVYIFIRALQMLSGFSLGMKVLLSVIYWLVAFSLVIAMLTRHIDMPVLLSKSMFHIGSAWLVFTLYMIFALLIADVTKLFVPSLNHGFYYALGVTCCLLIQSPNQKIPDRKTKCVIKTHINIKQNVIFSAKLKPV